MGSGCMECGAPLIDNLVFCPRCSVLDMLLVVAQLSYRKHVQNDDRIGWEELSERLQTALSEAMGDAAFQEWVKL
jgi:hypothetical protein